MRKEQKYQESMGAPKQAQWTSHEEIKYVKDLRFSHQPSLEFEQEFYNRPCRPLTEKTKITPSKQETLRFYQDIVHMTMCLDEGRINELIPCEPAKKFKKGDANYLMEGKWNRGKSL